LRNKFFCYNTRNKLLGLSLSHSVSSQHNTFQCVLAYSVQSGAQTPVSYVLFLYKDGAMQWSRGAGEGSEPALVGIKNGESRYESSTLNQSHAQYICTRNRVAV
jgi:hypothetical protein